MTISMAFGILFGGLLALHLLATYLESRGLLRYRKYRKSAGSGIGSSLHELNALARPSNHHVMHVMQTRPELKEEEQGGDGVKVVLPPGFER